LITATQVHVASSFLENTNLLAAGIGYGWHSSGSGIYSKGKILESYFNSNSQSANKLLIAKVPIIEKKEIDKRPIPQSDQKVSQMRGLLKPNFKPFDLSNADVKIFSTADKRGRIEASISNLKCSLNFVVSNLSVSSNEQFALFAQVGKYCALQNTQICGLVKCASGSNCLDATMISNSFFDFLNLTMIAQNQGYFLPLVSTNESGIISLDKINFNQNFPSYNLVPKLNEINKAILSLSIFGLNW